MKKEGNSMKTISMFRNSSIEDLEWDIKVFLNLNYDDLELVNVNVTYNTDEEEYIGVVIYNLFDKKMQYELKSPDEVGRYRKYMFKEGREILTFEGWKNKIDK